MRKIINNIGWRLLAACLFCLLGVAELSAQQTQRRAVRGSVVDGSGAALAGAMVRVSSDGARTTITDAKGAFSIMAAPNETLTVSFVGYKETQVGASQGNPVVKLQPDLTTLDEVVVVGYGSQKKATLTGAISAIGNKDIVVTKNENVINMLSGKVPGLQITQSSSQPGNFEDTKISIRGFGIPMFVVDGVVRDKGYFSRMDASEIANVSVLKDGSAAVYGVDGGNGVILITTKRGSASDGKFNISISANHGWQNFLYIPQTAKAHTNMMLINEKAFNRFNENYMGRVSPVYTTAQMLEYSSGKKKSTDWNNELFAKNVPQYQYNLSMDGGTDKVSYYFNIGYLNQEGSYKSGSLNYNRWNLRSNTDVNITKRLRASISIGGYIDERNEPNTGIWTVYKKAWTYSPAIPAWLDEEKTLPTHEIFVGSDVDNPVATTDSKFTGFRNHRNTNLNASFSMTYDIPGVKGLNLRAFYDYNYSLTNNKEYLRQYNTYSYGGEDNKTLIANKNNINSSLSRRIDPSYSEVYSVSANYANSFGGHNVTGTVVWEERQGNADGVSGSRTMSLDGEYLMFGDATDSAQKIAQGAINAWAKQAMVGRATYNFKERYLGEFAFRYEGASNFPKKGMWKFFPSVLLAWRLSEEPFMKRLVPFLTNFKIRGSYGEMGGGSYNVGRAVTGYEISEDQVGWFYGPDYMSGVKTNAVPNENLTWTTVRTSNIGADFDLWNGRLHGSFDLFNRLQTGIRRKPDTQIPVEVGTPLPEQNLDADRTFGWEIVLGHRNQIRGFRYWIEGQISATKNRWVKRQDTRGDNSSSNYRRVNVAGRNKDIWFSNKEEGGRLNSWDEIRYHDTPLAQGTLPGDYWYEDWNGDGVINDDDLHPVATFQMPTFNYGITLGAAWKGVDFTMNWQGSAGVYSSYGEVFTGVDPFGRGGTLNMYLDRWHTAGYDDDPWNPNTKWIKGYYPATGHSFSEGTSGIRNASYIRLKTLEVGYTLPNRWLAQVGMKDVRFYVNAYNLLTFTGLKNVDPERPGGTGGAWNSDRNNSQSHLFYRYPVNRTVNLGASLKF